MTAWRGVGPHVPPPTHDRNTDDPGCCAKCRRGIKAFGILPCGYDGECKCHNKQVAVVEQIIGRDRLTRVEWSVRVAGLIGIRPPADNHDRWLRLHRSEAAACMTSREYQLLSQQMGWIRTVVVVGRDKLRLVSRSRWRDSVETLADLACAVTRHRFCHRIYSPAWVWAEKTETVVFETLVSPAQARAIFPDAFLEDDDE